MSKTLNIIKNYVDTTDSAIVAFSNINKVLTGIPVKEIKIYFDLPIDDDDSGTPTKDSVNEVLPVIEAILETDEQILSLSYEMYNMNVTDSDGDLGHNLTLTVFVPNGEDSHGVNTLGEAEFHLDYRTEYVTLERNGHYYTMQGEIPFTTTVYDLSYEELPDNGEKEEPRITEPTTVPKPLLVTDSVSYKVADSMVVHISDTDTVTFTGDEVSAIFYAKGSVILTSVSELALQHVTENQYVEVFTKGVDVAGVVTSGYISEISTGENVTVITLVDELPDLPDSDKETSPIESYAKGEPGVEGKPVHLSSEGTIQGKTIQLGNTSISFGDKTTRITADKITLEGVTIVQEPHVDVKNNVTDMSGTHTLGELFEGLDGK